MSPEHPSDKSKPPATPAPKDTPKCRRCQSPQLQVMGRIEKSKETFYRCEKCGFMFTTSGLAT